MPYRVEPLDLERFAVIDDSREPVYVGTLAECTDWLDAAERCEEQPAESREGSVPPTQPGGFLKP